MADRRDEALRKRYRELATEEPSAAIDDAIRAAARRAVSSAPGGARRPMRWAVPVSLAAVLFLSFGVVMRMEKEVPSLESEMQTRVPEGVRAPAPAPAATPETPATPAAPAPQSAPQFAPAPKKERAVESPRAPPPQQAPGSPAPDAAPLAKLQAKSVENYREPDAAAGARAKDSAALRDEAPAVAERAVPADKRFAFQKEAKAKADAPAAKTEATVESKVTADAIAPSKPKAAMVSPATSTSAPAPAAAAAPATAPPPPMQPEEQRANAPGRSDELGRAASGALAQRTTGLALPDPWPATATPEKKLERIEELRKAGRDREADEALARFKREHPGYRIPDATWERIKPR